MKLIKLLMLFLIGAFAVTSANGQTANASLNIITLNNGQVGLGQTGDIQVSVGNTGPGNILANKVRAQISIPIAIASALPNAQQTGLPPGWTITVNTGGSITVCNGSDVIPAGTQRQVFIKVTGTALGGPSTVNGSLLFSSGTSCTIPGTLSGDNVADNTATTSIQTVPASACSLNGVSASAGTIACFGGTTTLTATPSFSGAAVAVEYSLNGGAFQSANTFTVNAGSYIISAREAATTSCTATASAVNVTAPAQVVANSSIVEALCFGGNASVTISGTGGTAPYTGTGTFAQAAGTTQSYTVTDANGCSAAVSVTTAAAPSQVVVGSSVTQALCFGGSASVVISATGGTAPYTGTGTFTQAAGTTQSYTVTDANGCTGTISVTTAAAPSAITASATAGSALTCNGGTTTLTVTASGGTGAYEYSLNGGAFQAANTFTTGAGTYTITVRDVNGCTGTAAAVTITEPSAVTASAVITTPIPLPGGTGTITVSAIGGTGAKTYVITSGTTINTTGATSGVFTGLSAGTYSFTATDANGCTGVATVSLNNPVAGPANASLNILTLNGGQVTVGGVVDVQVTVGNTGPSFIGSNKVRAQISIPIAIASALPNAQQTGLPAGWTITANTGGSITICNGTDQIPAGAQRQIFIKVAGNVAGGPSTINGSLLFSNGTSCTVPGTLTGDNVADNTATTSILVISNCSLNGVTASAGTIACFGGNTTLTATPSFSGASVAVEYSLNGGAFQASNTFSVGAGIYTITAREVASPACTATATAVTITQPTQLVASSTASSIACFGGSSTVTVAATGGTAPYTGTGTFSRTAGTYTFTVTDANGCTATTSVTITEPTQLVASSTASSIACFGGSSTVTVAATGGTAPYTGTGTFSRTAGTYTFTVTDANGCTATTSVTITEPTQLVASSTASSIACFGGSSTVTVSATGGTAPYTGTGTFSRTAGTYTFTVTDANGCTATTSVTITQPTQLVASSTASSIACFGGSSTVTVAATGGTAPYTGTGTFSRTAGTYTFTVTDANGCTAVTTITIAEPAVLLASSTATSIACFGGSSTVTVSATGGTAPYTGTGAFSRTAGTYTFTVTDAKGCTAVTTVTITQPAQLVASATAGTIACNGGSTTLTVTASGGTGALQYSLNGGTFQSGNNFTVGAGSYTITVRDASNCTVATASVTVTQPVVLTAATTVTSATSGSNGTATAIPTGGTAPYTYSWNTVPVQTTATATGLGAGTYTVTVTDARGCTATATATVTANGCNLIVNAGLDQVLCNGASVTLTAGITGGTSSLPATTLPFAEAAASTAEMRIYSGNIEQITIGNTFSQSEDRTNCGQNTSSSKTLTIPAGAVVKKAFLYWSGSGSLDNQVKLNGTSVTADGTKTYARSGGFNYFAARKDVTSLVTASGTYTVNDLTWNNANPYCFDNSAYGGWAMTVIYEQATLPNARIHVNTEKFQFTYPAGTYSTTINNISVPAGCTPDAKLTIVAFEGDRYKGERLRINGVLDADTNNFRGQSGPNLDIITKNAPSVAGGTTSLTYSIESYQTNSIFGPAIEGLFDYVKVLKYNYCPVSCSTLAYQWTKNGAIVGTTQSIIASSAGSYAVKVTDCKGCIANDTVVVVASTLAATSVVGTPIACFGGTTTVTVSATGGTAPYTGTGTFIKGCGTYTFTVTDAKGCNATTTIVVTQPAELLVTATAPAIPCSGTTTTVTVSATGGTAPYTGTGTFSRTSGTYTFTVTDAKGCTKSATITIAAAIACGPVDPNKCYRLLARHSGKAATVAGNSLVDGGNVEQRTFSGGANQIWKFALVETGFYKVTNQNSGKVLDVAGVSTADGANVQQWSSNNGNNQKWSLTANGAYFAIKAKHSGKAMSVAGSSSANGANVEQRGTGSNFNEQWAIEQVGCPAMAKGPELVPLQGKGDETLDAFTVTVMPNPSSDYFTMIVKGSNTTDDVSVRVLDLGGKVIAIYKTGINTSLKLGEARWAAGTYFAEITQGGQRKVIQLVKAN
jgi:Ricin-type beta-trefoil lectin domain-like/Secretion system C-terminal sorting domain/SprB repeat